MTCGGRGSASRSSTTRRGEDEPQQRLLLLAGSVPAGVAAVALGPARTGTRRRWRSASRSCAWCCRRERREPGLGEPPHQHRRPRCGGAVRALDRRPRAVPVPRLAIAIAGESGQVLSQDREAVPARAQRHDWDELKPSDPTEALDAHHFAERFGLFLIILLGEVGSRRGQGAEHARLVDAGDRDGARRGAVVAALRRGGRGQPKVLDLSGGSPTMARAIFAVGHMVPGSRCWSSPAASAC